jgi:hypothetical protein
VRALGARPVFPILHWRRVLPARIPAQRSDLSHWRKRLGDKLELLLAESLRVAHEAGALRGKDLKRVTVDTTVQPKAITFPTDAKLLHAAIKGLNRLATRHGVRLRQSYSRVRSGGKEYAQANTTQWEQSAWGDEVIHMSDGTRSRDLLAS